jgi:hypothetical protein
MGTENEAGHILFVYQVMGTYAFLIYDGQMYYRFVNVKGTFRFVRRQRSLPRYASGNPAAVNDAERRQLEREAHRHHVPLAFYPNIDTCLLRVAHDNHQQLVYGMSPPAGYFLLNSLP